MPKLTEYVQIAEAARILGVCCNTLRNWGEDGKIEEYRHPINNYRLYKTSDLLRIKKKILNPTKSRKKKPR